jgi:methyl-accepting chemotaxis protein
MDQAFSKAMKTFRSLEVNQRDHIDASIKSTEETNDRYVRTSLVLLVVALVVVLLMSWIVIRSIANPLAKVVHALKQIAQGDLAQTLEVKSSDELGVLTTAANEMVGYLEEKAKVAGTIANGDLECEISIKSKEDQLAIAFTQMRNNLRQMIDEIRTGSDRVVATSGEIAAANEQSTKNSQLLSGASDEITATIHEMAASIKQVASNASTQTAAATEASASVIQMVSNLQSIAGHTRQLSELSNATDKAAQSGRQTLQNADHNIKNIGDSVESAGATINSLGVRAESIGKIVETIDDIADQTNLLALNAAIEAARAGEHGLGFAVVADEVRKLAERSARSTKEIGELIEAIQRDARAAVEQMDASNKTVREYIDDQSVKESLDMIIQLVEKIVRSTREIEVATNEQSAGAEQVSKTTQDLNRLTQEIYAATEEQSTGASEVVKSMEQLRGIVQQSVQMSDGLQRSAEGLYQQSDLLLGVVRKFKVANTKGGDHGLQSFVTSQPQYQASRLM